MKTHWKMFIAIVLFFLIDFAAGYILYTHAWIKMGGENIHFPTIVQTKQPVQQKTFSFKTYSDPQLNLTFNYPTNIQLVQVRPHLIGLRNPSNTSSDSTLYIFETTATNSSKTVNIPFVIKGNLTKQTPIPVRDFTAKQLTYSDGVIFLTLRKNQEFIMVRIPKDSSGVTDAITDFVDSVKLLK